MTSLSGARPDLAIHPRLCTAVKCSICFCKLMKVDWSIAMHLCSLVFVHNGAPMVAVYSIRPMVEVKREIRL